MTEEDVLDYPTDDHPVVRQGIIANLKLQRDMTVVGEANDGVEALALIKEQLPDVVLLDLRMPGMDGLDVVAEVKASRLPAISRSKRFVCLSLTWG